jgi:RNA polymerase sigma factor (sigma-70 family)
MFLKCQEWVRCHGSPPPGGEVVTWTKQAHWETLRKRGSQDRFQPKYRVLAKLRFDQESEKLNPARAMEDAERDSLVRAAVDELPPLRREVTRLQMDGWSEKQMSHELGITIAAVKSQLHRARKQLGERLKCLRD